MKNKKTKITLLGVDYFYKVNTNDRKVDFYRNYEDSNEFYSARGNTFNNWQKNIKEIKNLGHLPKFGFKGITSSFGTILKKLGYVGKDPVSKLNVWIGGEIITDDIICQLLLASELEREGKLIDKTLTNNKVLNSENTVISNNNIDCFKIEDIIPFIDKISNPYELGIVKGYITYKEKKLGLLVNE